MPLLILGVIVMTVAQLLDLTTYMAMVRQLGPMAEVNPIVRELFAGYGFPAVAIAKVVLLAIVSSIAAILVAHRVGRPARFRLAGGIVALGILIGLVGGLSNVAAIGVL
jgi:hypothetical protein